MLQQARIFGGSALCTTDVAVAQNLIRLGDPARVRDLEPSVIQYVNHEARLLLEDGVDRLKTSPADIPLIAVGGGSFLVPKSLHGVSEVVFVPHHDVANAIGAAIAQVSGEVDQVFNNLSRDEAISHAVALARSRAEQAGAEARSVNVVDVEELPLAYMPGNSRRVRVRVAGVLAGV
jgi:hypothetical protein